MGSTLHNRELTIKTEVPEQERVAQIATELEHLDLGRFAGVDAHLLQGPGEDVVDRMDLGDGGRRVGARSREEGRQAVVELDQRAVDREHRAEGREELGVEPARASLGEGVLRAGLEEPHEGLREALEIGGRAQDDPRHGLEDPLQVRHR